MACKPTIEIQEFQPEDQAAVKELILAGLVEHWGYLDPHKNPDLDNIASCYSQAVFLVAHHQGRVVGTGALVPGGSGIGEIVRMSVAQEYRRKGIGRQILQELSHRARLLGCHRLILETTSTWQEVIDFYLDFGFIITHSKDGDVYFRLDL